MFWDRKNTAMGNSQRRPKGRHRTKPPTAATNLDAESKRAAHFRSPWQQNVNVFGAWSRPECVEELHQEAQLNLQTLLQDFEEQLYDSKQTGQTFRHPSSSHSSDDTSASLSLGPSPSGLHNNNPPDFLFLSSSKHPCEDDSSSSLGLGRADPSPSPSPSPCGSDRPLVAWGGSGLGLPPPVAEKPRWHLGRRTPAHLIPLDITGEGKLLGVDLLQTSSCSPSPSPGDQPRSLEPITDTPLQHLPLRKTHSDLDASLPQSPPDSQMDHSSTLLCSSSNPASWNGPPGSTFSPGAWNEAYSYTPARGPGGQRQQQGIVGNVGVKGVPQSQSASFASEATTPVAAGGTTHHLRGGSGVTMAMMMGMGRRSETEGAAAVVATAATPGQGEGRRERSARSVAAANAFKFRERSLSTPTDSGSFCSSSDNVAAAVAAGNGTAAPGGVTMMITDHQHLHQLLHPDRGESYALLYPSGSSEDGASVDGAEYGGQRARSRSISLKKPKRKPPPPVRSVSLVKNLGDGEERGRAGEERRLYRDGRPKSLHIPREHLQDFQPDFLLQVPHVCAKPQPEEPDLCRGVGLDHPPTLEVQGPERESELGFPAHWQLGEWKSSDPYRSLSGSSTATGTTVVECMKVRGSSESLLDSPSTSRATSPSQLSIEAETKGGGSSPFRPPGLMSPSSGYSSQSETPTPTVPANQTTGTLATTPGCKMRPKIPERKSSLPATSPRDPSARSRLSFEMPGNAHLELSSLKPKQKAGRRHSDTSAAAKPGKVSPSPSTASSSSASAVPVVTQNELRNVRLRSVSRSDLDDLPDGAASADVIEEEQGRDLSPPPVVAPKTKPPVAVKPPLPKRPLNLLFKSPSPSSSPLALDSPPASPVDRPVPVGNIYKVMRKPKPKRPTPQTPPSPSDPTPSTPHPPYDYPFLPHSQSLYDLPPLPDPQPLLEDPGMEPEFDQDAEHLLGPEDGGSLPSPCSQESHELQDKSKTLPSRMTISCLAELEKKKAKVPPPVPKKPNVLLLPSVHSNGNMDRQMDRQADRAMDRQADRPMDRQADRPMDRQADRPMDRPVDKQTNRQMDRQMDRQADRQMDRQTDRQMDRQPDRQMDKQADRQTDRQVDRPTSMADRQTDRRADSPVGLLSPPRQFLPEEEKNHVGGDPGGAEEKEQTSLQDSLLTDLEETETGTGTTTDDAVENSQLATGEKMELHITEETDDRLMGHAQTTHTTEDLFTIIHRSKRKVLGRKEPGDSFGSRQSLSSPVKHSPGSAPADPRPLTLGRPSSRNDTFMALLQKKGSKSSSGAARVSAAELLRSTKPLARRAPDPASTSTGTNQEAGGEGPGGEQGN